MSTQVNRYRGRLLAGFAGTALAASFAQSASAAVMTSYSFEGQPTGTTTGTTLAPLAANVGTGSFTGVHASASTAYSFPSGNGTANSSSSNTWATGDYYQFTSPGTAGLQIEFDQTSSSTGPGTFQVQYSADGGAFIIPTGYSYTLDKTISFASATTKATSPPRFLFDFTGFTDIETASTVTFRLVDTAATGAAGGTDRVDTVLAGTNLPLPAVPEPATVSLAGLTALGLLGRRRGR